MAEPRAETLGAETIWENCLGVLRHQLPQEVLSTWLMQLRPSLKSNNQSLLLCLYANTEYCAQQVIKHYKNIIQNSLKSIPGGTQLGLEVRTEHSTPVFRGLDENGLDPQSTFESFVRGTCNSFAYESAWGVATRSTANRTSNPLLMCSESGLGKTHLLMAIGNEIRQRAPHRRVLYMVSEQFYKGVVKAIQDQNMDAFNERCRNVDVLLIDDIHALVGKDRCQLELFNTFNYLWTRDRQIIFSSDREPLRVDLAERLRSRLNGGLQLKLHPPELETRIAILCAKARQNWNYELPQDVAQFIAEKISFNVRELEGALNTVYSYALNAKKAIDLPLVQEALRGLLRIHAEKIPMETIQKAVATYHEVDVAHLIGPSRSRVLVRPRHMAMALARELTDFSLPDIGKHFGGRDHTTVLNACKKIKILREQDPDMENTYQNLSRLLRHHRGGDSNNNKSRM